MSSLPKFEKRERLIINKSFQIKISFYFIAVSALCCTVILYVLLHVHGTNIRFLQELIPQDTLSLAATIYKNKILVYLLTSLFFVLLSGFLFLMGLYYSHRIIGPISRLANHMESMVSENFPLSPFSLRKKDYLHHIKSMYNRVLFTIRERNRFYIAHAKDIIPYLVGLEETIKNDDPSFSLEKELDFLKTEITRDQVNEKTDA